MFQDILDIHGMSESEAIRTIEKHLASLDKSIKELTIIHGHNSGRTLKDMIANPRKIRSKRIKRRKYSTNPGETILELH